MSNEADQRGERNLAQRCHAAVETLNQRGLEVRDDRLTRGLYATDASIYEIVPDAVVWPRTVEQVQEVVRVCAAENVPLTPRGAGTGLSGGTCNRGIQLDCSRYLNRVLEIDPDQRHAHVQPGVVLDELNAQLAEHGLHFSPDVATASRATIGGMIGNNSAGAHSLVVGRTCDHVVGVDVVLADGSLVHWGAADQTTDNPHVHECEQVLTEILTDQADEISTRFPKVFRSNGGYALDRLRSDNGRLNVEQLIVGSEGTLGVVVGATLSLLPLPRWQGLCVIHFNDLLAALDAVTTILEHQPAAIELLDKQILDGTKDNPAMQRRRERFLEGDPQAILIVEFYEDTEDALRQRLHKLAGELRAQGTGYAHPVFIDPDGQADVWAVRKAGTGLLMSSPGQTQPYDFIDDCSVPPQRLRNYIQRLQQILDKEGIERTGYYAHASVGLLHVRPALNLRRQTGVEKLRRIADQTSRLVHEFEGAMTGEHGEGLVRSEWIERLFGTQLVQSFKRIKQTFDPLGIFNPHKIVDPLPMDANLRYGAGYTADQPDTILDFSRHGGMAGLADMCSGIGECRKRLVGTMCPSYMATGNETNTTRARANALRLALSNRNLLDGLSDPALDEVFDLCLSCKACKTECPTGTDMTKLKAEWLHHRNERLGVPLRSRMIAMSIQMAIWGTRFAPLSNWFMQSKVARVFLEHFCGFDRRVPLPKFAHATFRKWFAKHEVPASAPRGPVVYFVDTWTNYYLPQVGQATVKVLEALGYEVLTPETVCCGRPLLSKGMLKEARLLAEDNIDILIPFADGGVPIVGTEPSCVSVLNDELPELVRTPEARRIAEVALPVYDLVAGVLRKEPDALRFKPGRRPLLYHGHCHQKALTGTSAAMHLLAACTNGGASEIDSGCCGMAGAFGHEVEHYDVAHAVGEQRLFPAVRQRDGADVAVAGFSCRHHIDHHTAAGARHLMEYVADALAD